MKIENLIILFLLHQFLLLDFLHNALYQKFPDFLTFDLIQKQQETFFEIDKISAGVELLQDLKNSELKIDDWIEIVKCQTNRNSWVQTYCRGGKTH